MVTHSGEKTQMFRDRVKGERQSIIELQWKKWIRISSYNGASRLSLVPVWCRLFLFRLLADGWKWWWAGGEGDRSLRIPSYPLS